MHDKRYGLGPATVPLALGALLGAGVLAWRASRAGEAALAERTRARLRRRYIEPSAADIHIGRVP